MATEKHAPKESSRELLELLLSPGSTRVPILNVEEIKQILDSGEQNSAGRKDRKATTVSDLSKSPAKDH
jgi:hypothetical protein